MIKKEEEKYLFALHSFPKFGPVRLKKIFNFFPGPKEAFFSSLSGLIEARVEEKIANEFIATRNNINPEVIEEKIKKENIKYILLGSRQYPRLLAEIYDPPALLFYKGKFETKDEYSLAIVGTRKYSNYGLESTEHIAGELAKNNITIVSGLAYGIDTLAHNACLNANGRTIAVLGTGIDKQSIYPSSNRYLSEKIIGSNGLIVSEFPLETPPLRHNFPQRNRIISGLSLGTIVVEAAARSGALITARFALEQNREVFAVPGNIFSKQSIGPNNLIKQGARPVSNAQEILDTLDLTMASAYIENKKIIPDNKHEALVIEVLGHEPIHVDEIIRLTNLTSSIINSTLTLMEMKGKIKNIGGMQYILAR